MVENEEKKQGEQGADISRREILKRSVKAGAAAALIGGVSLGFLDREGPSGDEAKELVALGDLSVEPREGKVMSVVKGADRAKSFDKAVDLLGGIEHFVKKGETVLVKVNAAFASSPRLGATSNPELVKEVVRLCYARGGAGKVIVADNPINDPESCFKLTGIGRAAEDAGAELMLPKDFYFADTTVEGARLIREWPVFYEPYKRADKVIGVSPVKDHDRSGASMSMKNWYGLLGGRRNIFHQDINGIISELAMMVRPTLVVLDGTVVMKSNGPTGGSMSDLRREDTMIVSCDQVAADSFGAGLLGMSIDELGYLRLAEEKGVGTTKFEQIGILRGEVG